MRVGMQRLLFSIVPALILLALGTAIVFGHNGLMSQWNLRSEMRTANTELAAIERENHALLREIRLMQRDESVRDQLSFLVHNASIVLFEMLTVAEASAMSKSPVPSKLLSALTVNAPEVRIEEAAALRETPDCAVSETVPEAEAEPREDAKSIDPVEATSVREPEPSPRLPVDSAVLTTGALICMFPADVS